jgi:hypothetical protein
MGICRNMNVQLLNDEMIITPSCSDVNCDPRRIKYSGFLSTKKNSVYLKQVLHEKHYRFTFTDSISSTLFYDALRRFLLG